MKINHILIFLAYVLGFALFELGFFVGTELKPELRNDLTKYYFYLEQFIKALGAVVFMFSHKIMNVRFLKRKHNCPVCGGKNTANLKRRWVVLTFRQVEYNTLYHFYECNTCMEKFTTTMSDETTLKQIPDYDT